MIVRELYFRVLAATLMLFSATMHVLYALSHLQDLSTTSANGLQDYNSTLSLRAAKFRREKNIDRVIVAKMQNAGLNTTSMDPEVLSLMPKWSEIETAIVPGPRILGLDTCKAFQAIVADNDRYVGVSGMFNSGTNVLASLLEENCMFEEVEGEALWQVPWGKHSRATRRDIQTVPNLIQYNKTRVLPAIVVRNPFEVLDSNCRNSYSIHFPDDVDSVCPHMVHPKTGDLLPIEVGKYKPGTKYPSVIHYWNTWYREYFREFTHPRLIIRLEDLIVYPRETVRSICECAGGSMSDGFALLVSSAKMGMGHGAASEANGLIEAWLRLGREIPFAQPDYEAIKEYVDRGLMETFGYHDPPRKAD